MSNLTLSFRDKILSVHPLDEDGITEIGSQVESGIHIDSLAVSPRHAWVVTKEEKSVLEDLGSESGTFVNGQKITEPYTLKDGDRIHIGKHSLVFKFEAKKIDHVQVAFKEHKQLSAWIQFLNGDNLGKTVPLTKSITNLGKHGTQAAVISRREGGYFLSHLEGDESPRVNDEDIGDQSYALHSGDRITIGKIKLLFYTEEQS